MGTIVLIRTTRARQGLVSMAMGRRVFFAFPNHAD